jgi:hypothetical protein
MYERQKKLSAGSWRIVRVKRILTLPIICLYGIILCVAGGLGLLGVSGGERDGNNVAYASSPTLEQIQSYISLGNLNVAAINSNADLPGDNFRINSAQGIQNLSALCDKGVSFVGKTVYLTATMNLGGAENNHNPINGFAGTFDGMFFSVNGININRPTINNQGFFHNLPSTAVIKNLTVGGTIIGQNNVGGISSRAQYDTLIINCVNNVNVSGAGVTGGITGQGGRIINCRNHGTITARPGQNHFGGISGETQWVFNSINYGQIINQGGNRRSLGGLVGFAPTGDPHRRMFNSINAGVLPTNLNGTRDAALVGQLEEPANVSLSNFNNLYAVQVNVNAIQSRGAGTESTTFPTGGWSTVTAATAQSQVFVNTLNNNVNNMRTNPSGNNGGNHLTETERSMLTNWVWGSNGPQHARAIPAPPIATLPATGAYVGEHDNVHHYFLRDPGTLIFAWATEYFDVSQNRWLTVPDYPADQGFTITATTGAMQFRIYDGPDRISPTITKRFELVNQATVDAIATYGLFTWLDVQRFTYASAHMPEMVEGKTFFLNNNIVFPNHANHNLTRDPAGGEDNWYQMSNVTFDGRGRTISNIIANDPFFVSSRNSTFKNLTLSGTVHRTAGVMGGWMRRAENTRFENCTNNLAVVGSNQVGGFVGRVSTGAGETVFNNCVNNVMVNGTGSSVGGFVGLATSTLSIMNSSNFGSISGTDGIGGLVGGTNESGAPQIINSANYGQVRATATNGYAAGIIGIVETDNPSHFTTINNVLNMGTVTSATPAYAAGIVGFLRSDYDGYGAKISNIYSIGANAGAIASGQPASRWFARMRIVLNEVSWVDDMDLTTAGYSTSVHGWEGSSVPWAPILTNTAISQDFMIILNIRTSDIPDAIHWGLDNQNRPRIGQQPFLLPPTAPVITTLNFTSGVWTNEYAQIRADSIYTIQYRVEGYAPNWAPWNGTGGSGVMLFPVVPGNHQGTFVIQIRAISADGRHESEIEEIIIRIDNWAPEFAATPITSSVVAPVPSNNITLTAHVVAQNPDSAGAGNVRYFWSFGATEAAALAATRQGGTSDPNWVADRNGFYVVWAVDDLDNGMQDNYRVFEVTNFIGDTVTMPILQWQTLMMTQRQENGQWVWYSFTQDKAQYEAGLSAGNLRLVAFDDIATMNVGDLGVDEWFVVWHPVAISQQASGLTRIHVSHGELLGSVPALIGGTRWQLQVNGGAWGNWENLYYGVNTADDEPYIYLDGATGTINIRLMTFDSRAGSANIKYSLTREMTVRLSDTLVELPDFRLVSGGSSFNGGLLTNGILNFELLINATGDNLGRISHVEWRVVNNDTGAVLLDWARYTNVVPLNGLNFSMSVGDVREVRVEFRQVDLTWQTGAIGQRVITFDYSNPTMSIVVEGGNGTGADVDNPIIGQSLTFRIEANDDAVGLRLPNPVQYSFDGGTTWINAVWSDELGVWTFMLAPSSVRTVVIRTVDLAGNMVQETFHIIVTNDVPRVTVSVPSGWQQGTTKNVSFEVDSTEFEVTHYRISQSEIFVDSDWVVLTSDSFTLPHAEGTWYIWVKNELGFVSGRVMFVVAELDDEQPTIESVVVHNEDGIVATVGESLTIYVTADDDDGSGVVIVQYSLNGTTWHNATWNGNEWEFTLSTSFDGTIQIKAIDAVGHESSISTTARLVVATRPTVSAIVSNGWQNDDKDVIFTASWENGYVITELLINQTGNIGDGTWVAVSTLGAGFVINGTGATFTIAHDVGTWYIWARDANGLTSARYAFTINQIDRFAPEMEVERVIRNEGEDDEEIITDGLYTGEKLTFIVSAADVGADEIRSGIFAVKFSLDLGATWHSAHLFANYQGFTNVWVFTVFAPHTGEVWIKAVDNADNDSLIEKFTGVTVSSDRPLFEAEVEANSATDDWKASDKKEITVTTTTSPQLFPITQYLINQTGNRTDGTWRDISTADEFIISVNGNVFVLSLGEGIWFVWIRDNQGFVSNRHTIVIDKLDTEDPTIDDVSIAHNGNGSGTVSSPFVVEGANSTIYVTASDIGSGVAKVLYSLDGGATWLGATNNGIARVFNIPAGASHVFNGAVRIQAFDLAGNSSDIEIIYIIVTTLKPTITNVVVEPSGWVNTETKEATFTFGNDDTYVITHFSLDDGITWLDIVLLTTTHRNFAAGEHSILVKNELGIISQVTEFTVDGIDTIAPTFSIDHNGNGTGASAGNPIVRLGNLDITVNTFDIGSGAKNMEWHNGTSWQTLADGVWQFTVSAEFSGVIRIRVIDNVGNVSEELTLHVVATNNMPTVSVNVPNSDVWQSGHERVVTITPSTDATEFRIEGLGWNSLEWHAISTLPAQFGEGTYSIWVRNSLGIESFVETFTVSHLDNTTPVISRVGIISSAAHPTIPHSTIITIEIIMSVIGVSGLHETPYYIRHSTYALTNDVITSPPMEGGEWITGPTISITETGYYYIWVRNAAGTITLVSVEVLKFPPYGNVRINGGVPNMWTSGAKEVEIFIDVENSPFFGNGYIITRNEFFRPSTHSLWVPWTSGTKVFLDTDTYYLWVKDSNNNISFIPYVFTIANIDRFNPTISVNPSTGYMTLVRGESDIKSIKVEYFSGGSWIVDVGKGSTLTALAITDGGVFNLNLSEFTGFIWRFTVTAESGRESSTVVDIASSGAMEEFKDYIVSLINTLETDGVTFSDANMIKEIEDSISAYVGAGGNIGDIENHATFLQLRALFDAKVQAKIDADAEFAIWQGKMANAFQFHSSLDIILQTAYQAINAATNQTEIDTAIANARIWFKAVHDLWELGILQFEYEEGKDFADLTLPSGVVITIDDEVFDIGLFTFLASLTLDGVTIEDLFGLTIEIIKGYVSPEPLTFEMIKLPQGSTLSDIVLPDVVGGRWEWMFGSTLLANGMDEDYLILIFIPDDETRFNRQEFRISLEIEIGTEEKEDGLPIELIIGIAGGIVLLLILAGVYLIMRKKRKVAAIQPTATPTATPKTTPNTLQTTATPISAEKLLTKEQEEAKRKAELNKARIEGRKEAELEHKAGDIIKMKEEMQSTIQYNMPQAKENKRESEPE